MKVNLINRKTRVGVFFLSWLILLTSCSYLQKMELEKNRRLWSSKKITKYRYTLKLNAYYTDSGKPVLIEVNDGKRVSLKSPEGELREPETFTALDTVEKMFETIEKEIGHQKYSLEVEYDESLGYPLYWRRDLYEVRTDGGWKFEISDFEVIQ